MTINTDQRADTSPLPPGTQRSPRTAAGRDLLRNLQKVQPEADSWIWWAEQGILAIEAEAAAEPRGVTPARASLLPYLRHGATCELQEVRDNAPWDEECTCGLREVYASLGSPEDSDATSR